MTTTNLAIDPRENAVRRWWRNPANRIPMLVFVTARLLTLIAGIVAVQSGPIRNQFASDPIFVQSMEARQLDNPLTFLVEPWHRWDTGWYMKIAVKGYDANDGSIIFAPLYPALMATLGKFVGDTLLAGLLISSAACLIFLLVFYRLTFLETGSNSAAQSTLFAFMAFPTAFYLMAGYTESTFLVFVAGALLAARHQKWLAAGVLAACATLTRVQGAVLFLPLAWLAFVQPPRFWQAQATSWRVKARAAIPRLLAVGLGPLMALAFFGFLSVAGLGSISDAYEKYWALLVRPPWASVIDVIGRVLTGTASLSEVGGLVALIFIVVLGLASLRTLPMMYHLYIWPTLILVLTRYYTPTLLNGTMRYVLDFFPIFITAGIFFAKHGKSQLTWIIAGGTLQAIMLYLFARWLWIA